MLIPLSASRRLLASAVRIASVVAVSGAALPMVHAAWTYTDVTEGVTATGPANTFSVGDDGTAWGGGTDGTLGWRFRNTGPGAPAFGTTAWTGRFVDADQSLYTAIGGLTIGMQYSVRVYGIFPSNATSRYGAEFSLDGGTTYTMVDNFNPGLTFVDNSNAGVGIDLGGRQAADARAFVELPVTVTANGSGVARIDLRLPATVSTGGAQDRFNIDGYALQAVPEPGSVALGMVGAAALLALKRRAR
jgi:hypothetical protein